MSILFNLIFVLSLLPCVVSFCGPTGFRNTRNVMKMNAPQLDDVTESRIKTLIANNKIVLFMKGNKLFPQCGFSNTACRILDTVKAQYETVNVLEDEKIRSGIKVTE